MEKKTWKKIVWHVFADNLDGFYPTLALALAAYRKLDKKDYPNLRLYWEEQDENGETVNEDYRRGRGEFPI